MITSEKIYYLKNDELYQIKANEKQKVDASLIINSNEKITLIIDDEYFFYLSLETVPVSGKKLKLIAGNYLNVIFPSDMVKSYGVYQSSGISIIYVLSEKLIKLINNNKALFNTAKQITMPFIELAIKYENFLFFDGIRIYKKEGNSISVTTDENNYITADSLFSEMNYIKSSVHIPGLQKQKLAKTPFIIPAAVLAVCYILFLTGNIISVRSAAKIDDFYNNELQHIYDELKVSGSSDPYGMLLFKVKQAGGGSNGNRVLNVLNNLSSIGENKDISVTFDTLNIRDKSIRISGTVADFTQVDTLKKYMENKLKKTVSMNETKKTEKGVSFVMRYDND